LRQRHAVKVSVAGHNLPAYLLAKPAVHVAELGSAANVLFGNAVNGHVVRVKVVAGVNEPHARANFTPVLKCDYADLANAAHSGVGGFKVNSNEPHATPLT
jgi:hypothetical protein